jgi:transposase-like protein
VVEDDDRLLCYPSLVRVLPGDAALDIDRRRERRLRPSVVVASLAAAQARPPKGKPEALLESLVAAYELLAAREGRPDPVLRLDALWQVLTMLPGAARDYSKPEFARDLYLLDQSGTVTSRSGRTLRFHASSGTRGAGVLTTVARTGQQQRYWGVSFTPARFAPVSERSGVLGGGSLPVPEWTTFLAQEYLAGYLPAGGAAVKVAVAGSADTASRLARALGAAADTAGCLFVSASAADVRLSQVDALFFAVARELDWDALAVALVRRAYDAIAFPAGDGVTVAEVAAEHDVDARELYRSVRRQLEQTLLGDPALARELRRAVLRLTQSQLGAADLQSTSATRSWRGCAASRRRWPGCVRCSSRRGSDAPTPGRCSPRWPVCCSRPAGTAWCCTSTALGSPRAADRRSSSGTASTTRKPRSWTPSRCSGSSSTPPTSCAGCSSSLCSRPS